MTVEGVDFSWARPGGAAIKAQGRVFVMRYCPYLGDGGKGLTASEITDYRANGLAIGIVFESTAGRMLDGYPAGQADATTAALSLNALGYPINLPVYFACDVDTRPEMLALVDDYLRGASSVLTVKRVGIYGEFDLVQHCRIQGTASWYWQTYAWSGGKVFEYNHVYQYSNGEWGDTVDFCTARDDLAGFWTTEEPMTAEEKAAFDALSTEVKTLRRIVGGPPADDFDLLVSIQNQEKALQGHIDTHPGSGFAPHIHPPSLPINPTVAGGV